MIARVAGPCGVAASWQLRRAGVSREALRLRVAAGRLHRLYRCVYALAPPSALSATARHLAAILACGPSAASSHRAAGHLQGFMRSPARYEVTAPRSRGPVEGIIVHRSRRLDPADVTVVDGIPVTSVARTIVDLADVLGERRLKDAIHECEVQRLFDLTAVREAQARVPGRAARHKLRRAIAAYGDGPRPTRGDYEPLVLEACEARGLRPPLVNTPLLGYEVDFYWPGEGLVVEMDDRMTHQTTRRFYSDRRRDRDLLSHGIRVARITPRDTADLSALGDELARLLSPPRRAA